MSEFIDVEWFDAGTSGIRGQTVGIVLVYDENDGFKCYMGIGNGVSANDDMENIHKLGVKIDYAHAKAVWGNRMRAEWISRNLSNDDLSWYMYDRKKYPMNQIREAQLTEHRLMQHQATNVLKSAKAVAEWSELRVQQLLKGE